MSSSSTTERRPSVFLSLAPATSDSYPQTTRPRQSSQASEPDAAVITEAASTATKRRTSSTSSTSSKSGLRFLKLGPVHDGEHLDGVKGDWHDLAVE